MNCGHAELGPCLITPLKIGERASLQILRISISLLAVTCPLKSIPQADWYEKWHLFSEPIELNIGPSFHFDSELEPFGHPSPTQPSNIICRDIHDLSTPCFSPLKSARVYFELPWILWTKNHKQPSKQEKPIRLKDIACLSEFWNPKDDVLSWYRH